MLSQKLPLLAAVLGLASLTTACTMVKNLDEMHDATKSMGDTTKGMADTTSHMSGTTDGMALTTSALYKDSRQGGSATIRKDNLIAMKQADSIEDKLAKSAEFQYGFEFQLWKPGIDSEETREQLYESAVIEYVREARELISGNVHDMDSASVAPTGTSDSKLNLYAYVGAMHKLNPNQEADAAKLGYPPTSMFDILHDGLLKVQMVKKGIMKEADLPRYAREVSRAYQDIIYMMQVRHNFLAALPLGFISHATDDRIFGIAGRVTAARMLAFPWNAELSGLTASQLAYYSLMMDKASDTRDLLVEMNEDVRTDGMITKIYKKRVFHAEDAQSAGPEGENLAKTLDSKIQHFVDGNG